MPWAHCVRDERSRWFHRLLRNATGCCENSMNYLNFCWDACGSFVAHRQTKWLECIKALIWCVTMCTLCDAVRYSFTPAWRDNQPMATVETSDREIQISNSIGQNVFHQSNLFLFCFDLLVDFIYVTWVHIGNSYLLDAVTDRIPYFNYKSMYYS